MKIVDQLHALTEVAALERRLYEVVGARAAAATDADEQRALAVEARHHSWHASLWEARTPLLHDVQARPPELPDDDALVERLGRRYDQLRAAATEVSDAPVLRALALIGLDH